MTSTMLHTMIKTDNCPMAYDLARGAHVQQTHISSVIIILHNHLQESMNYYFLHVPQLYS